QDLGILVRLLAAFHESRETMKHLHTKLIAATAALMVAATPVFAAEVSAGSEGNGETPRSGPGAPELSERGMVFMPEFDGSSARAFPQNPAEMERGLATLGRKAGGDTLVVPASTELKQKL